jgi:hydrogenase maturation factor
MKFDKDEVISSDIRADSKMLLQKASRMPTKWSDIFNAIEMFRKKVQAGRDSYDSTANDAQVGLMSPMLIMFALMLETNMTMEPLDTNIIINILSDNFKDQRHIDTLRNLLNTLHPDKNEFK